MHSENWDDLRYVLAVAKAGSVSAAARDLGVNHATVLRHIAAFEARHGVTLFDKSGRGYGILPENRRVIEAALEVEAAMEALDRQIAGTVAPLSGVVRVTSTDTFCGRVLPGALARIGAGMGETRIELISTNAHVDLSRLHADVTVRPAERLPDDLVGTVAARLGFAHYAPRGTDSALPWLGLGGPLARSRPAAWMAATLAPDEVAGGADSFLTLAEMAAVGLGQAILPCVLGEADPRLERRRLYPGGSIEIWVASHVDLADIPRLRAARALLGTALASVADTLLGPPRI